MSTTSSLCLPPLKIPQPKSSVGSISTGLALNVDVANGTFWLAQDVHQAARNFTGHPRNKGLSYTLFRDLLLPVRGLNGQYTMSEDFKMLRKMTKLKFVVKHRGKGDGRFLSPLTMTLNMVLTR